MDYLISLTLGIVQGIAEFLPISSSGHLVILQSLFGIDEGGLLLDTILHLGTALAVITVFRNDISALITNPFSRNAEKRTTALQNILFIIVATLPAAVVGILFNDQFETLFSKPKIAGAMLFVTSIMLFISALRKNDGGPVTVLKAIIIGIAQAGAIMPGISRSGSTIAIALLIGVSREEAGRFSFLMALPAIIGAGLLHAREIETINMPIGALTLGFIASVVIGIFSLKLLLKFVKKGRLYYFGFYCCIVGLFSVIYFN